MLQDREPYIWDALLDRYSPSGGRARPEQHSNHLAKEANSWAVRVLLNPSLNSLDRSQPPCPTQRDQHRQSVFLVEFNSRARLSSQTSRRNRKYKGFLYDISLLST
jgi:hypothetical protein